jgi:Na+-translocating ferredoxin:NAD+ oxidoreductase RNF subunit RnfB
MKLNQTLKLVLLLGAAVATLNITAFAGPGPQDYSQHVRTLEEAKKLGPATKVAFACKSCKTFSPIEKRKTFFSWFAPDQTHGCDGCGGKVTVRSIPGGKPQSVTVFSHVCTKCGDKSAYTCATHKS